MADLARIAPSIALRPWQQRPDEPLDDWMAFLVWLHTPPRPAVLPEGARAAAVTWQWTQRAAMAEVALAPRQDPAIMARDIAMNALTVLNVEMAWRAAESIRQPGGPALGELIQLMKLMADFRAAAPEPAEEAESYLDLKLLTEDERHTYTLLTAKCWRPRDR